MKFNVNHKVRFDRGRIYYSYFNSIITAFLVWVFSQGNLMHSILSGVSAFALIYFFWLFRSETKYNEARAENILGRKSDNDGYVSANFGVKHERAIKDFNKTDFCKAPFNFLTLNTDGSVVPCYSYSEIGNIRDGILNLTPVAQITASGLYSFTISGVTSILNFTCNGTRLIWSL